MNIPKSIAIFGASSAFGKNDIVDGGFAGRLRQWHEEIDIHNNTYNLGIPGAGIHSLLERLEAEAKQRNVDMIILQLGPNDARREDTPDNDRLTPLDEFRGAFAKLLEECKSIAPTVVVSVYPIDESRTTPVSWRDVYFFEKDVAEYAREMEQISVQAGIDYIDIYGEWTKLENLNELYIAEDGLHANSLGHEYIFERIRDKILSSYDQ